MPASSTRPAKRRTRQRRRGPVTTYGPGQPLPDAFRENPAARIRHAGVDAGARYERTVPRPMHNGSHGELCPLQYVEEHEAAGAPIIDKVVGAVRSAFGRKPDDEGDDLTDTVAH